MPQGSDFFDDWRVESIRHPEIVGSMNIHGVFDAGQFEGILWPGIDIMAQDDQLLYGLIFCLCFQAWTIIVRVAIWRLTL